MIAFYFTRLHELSELIYIFASSGVRSTDFLILLVEALCFILGNENVGNFHESKNDINGSAPYGVDWFVYFMSFKVFLRPSLP